MSVFSRFVVFAFAGALLAGCSIRPPKVAIPAQPPKVKMPRKPIKVALVLGAGGARGYAHLGVLAELHRAGVPINLVAGASVGSVVGALYADRGSSKEAFNAMMAAGFWSFADVSLIPKASGLMTGNHLQEFLLKYLHAKTFRQLKIPLVVATTDVYYGMPYVIASGPVAPAAEASAAIPGLVQPSYLYGRNLVDGGVTDPVPVDLVKRYHPKLIIAVNIDRKMIAEMPQTNVGILSRSYTVMWKSLARLSQRGADVVIYPDVKRAGVFDINKKMQLYHAGEMAAHRAMPRILKLMRSRGIKRVR